MLRPWWAGAMRMGPRSDGGGDVLDLLGFQC